MAEDREKIEIHPQEASQSTGQPILDFFNLIYKSFGNMKISRKIFKEAYGEDCPPDEAKFLTTIQAGKDRLSQSRRILVNALKALP